MRNVYIENNSLKETLDNYIINIKPIGTESINTIDAVGRVCSKAIFAEVCDPTYNASAMDGIAVCSLDTINASELKPSVLKEGQYQ